MLERLRPDRLPNREPSWFAADALLALALGYLTVGSMRTVDYVDDFGAVEGIGWALVLGPVALLLVRRAAPAAALTGAVAFYLVSALDHGEGNALLAAPFLAYTVALTRPARVSGAIVGLAAVVTATVGLYGPGPIDYGGPFVVMAFFALGWVPGAQVRKGQLRQEELSEQAEATQEEIAEVARQAVVDERARIARELHDAVGHAVNVMVMQAGAARLVAADERVVRPLQEIERVGRSALADLDRMLGLLHDADHGDAPLEPAHGLADIEPLVEGLRSAGADVHFEDRCSGALDVAVERPIGAAAYRIVQEALTNAVKHAGPARIDVTLACDRDEMFVAVVDDGRGAAMSRSDRTGRGLVGMQERVAVLGGRLIAEPRVGGGFRVEARLPRTKERV